MWSIKQKQFRKHITKLTRTDYPVSQIRTVSDNSAVVCYSRIHRRFLIITKIGDTEIAQTLRVSTDRLESEEPYGACSDFRVDNSNQFVIAVFPETEKLAILDIATGLLVLKIKQEHINLRQVFLDETGCFIATLNQSGNQVEIYMFEWKYDVKEPVKVVKVDTAALELLRQKELEE